MTRPAPGGRPPAPPAGGLHVVVGATGAVGRAVTARLVAGGRRVLAVARDRSALDLLAAGHGEHLVDVCAADLGTDDAVALLARAIEQRGDPVSLALFAAGLPVTGSVDVIEPGGLALAAGLKAAGTARLLRAVHAGLVPGSRIVAVAGSLGFEPGPRDAAPGTANAALVNLMRQVAQLYGPRGVVVHTLAPGPLETPRLHAVLRRPTSWPSTGTAPTWGTCPIPTTSPGSSRPCWRRRPRCSTAACCSRTPGCAAPRSEPPAHPPAAPAATRSRVADLDPSGRPLCPWPTST
jgi:NAD(P)-dependent dehydrogenase (short-subunit alcohol dehydrogenase family)